MVTEQLKLFNEIQESIDYTKNLLATNEFTSPKNALTEQEKGEIKSMLADLSGEI